MLIFLGDKAFGHLKVLNIFLVDSLKIKMQN